jgi:hypothetical protein
MSKPVHHRRVPRPHEAPAGQEVDAVNGLADLPQGFADEPAHVVGRRRRQNLQSSGAPSGSAGWVIPFGLLMVGVVVGGYLLTSHHEQAVLDQMRTDLRRKEEAIEKDFEGKYATLQKENRELQSQIEEAHQLKLENDQLREEGGHARRLRENLELRIDRLTKYKKKMQENIQLMSKTALLEK